MRSRPYSCVAVDTAPVPPLRLRHPSKFPRSNFIINGNLFLSPITVLLVSTRGLRAPQLLSLFAPSLQQQTSKSVLSRIYRVINPAKVHSMRGEPARPASRGSLPRNT